MTARRRVLLISPARWADDTGSLPFAMLLSLVGLSLTAMLVPTLITQIGSTRTQLERVRALHAAQAGIDLMLGRIKAAHAANVGDVTKLPCGPMNGRVDSDGNGPRYAVEVFYLDTDPRGRGLDDAWISAHARTCRADPTTYALVRSRGTHHGTTRTLWGTYVFRTTNESARGGLIRVFKTATSRDLCLDAGSATPAVGTVLRVRTCASGAPEQTFAYERSLAIALVSSRTAAEPTGLCLDAGAAHAAGNVVAFQRCVSPSVARQQWSFNDFANLEGTTDGVTLDGYCFNVANPDLVGSTVVLGSTAALRCNQPHVWNNRESWSPESSVGAGAAGPGTGQLVNFGQFGRCLDFPQSNDQPWASAWPCKQAPDPDRIAPNQRWTLPATAGGRMSVGASNPSLYPAAAYCLISPGAVNEYVDVTPCPAGAGTPANLRWTVRGYTGDYATSYRIEDHFGHCLAAKDAALEDFHSDALKVSKIIVVACSGSALQKWNAPPNLLTARFKDIGEK